MVYRRIECIQMHQCNCAALDIMAAIPGRGGSRSTREGCMAARAMVRMLLSTTSVPGVMSSCGVVTVWVCAAGAAGAASGMRTRAERGTVAVWRGWWQCSPFSQFIPNKNDQPMCTKGPIYRVGRWSAQILFESFPKGLAMMYPGPLQLGSAQI